MCKIRPPEIDESKGSHCFLPPPFLATQSVQTHFPTQRPMPWDHLFIVQIMIIILSLPIGKVHTTTYYFRTRQYRLPQITLAFRDLPRRVDKESTHPLILCFACLDFVSYWVFSMFDLRPSSTYVPRLRCSFSKSADDSARQE